MDTISFDTFLLLVLLILVGIVLFLSLVTAIYTIRLSRRIADLEKKDTRAVEPVVSRPVARNTEGVAVSRQETTAFTQEVVQRVQTPPKDEGKKPFNVNTDAPDIPTGIKNLCALYGLDSLTVSSLDGLVIASSGHPSAITEAAQFSYAFQTGEPIHDEGVQVFSVDYRANPLVGILRSQGIVQDSSLAAIKKDLELILEKWI
ncbi:MAG: hypothetical protein WC502_01880 [Methanolinea sp.]|jgi:hypothetical protein